MVQHAQENQHINNDIENRTNDIATKEENMEDMKDDVGLEMATGKETSTMYCIINTNSFLFRKKWQVETTSIRRLFVKST